MDLKELRKLPMPKLRDVAKQETELKNVGALEKEELIKAIAAAKNIPYDETHKDLNAVHAVKQDIRELQKRKAELLASNGKRSEIKVRLDDIVSKGDMRTNTVLMPGDVLIVPESRF